MKAILIVITVFISYSYCFPQSNVYFPLPDSNAMWRERCGGYQNPPCEDYQYLITGDTTLLGKIYHKIQQTGVIYAMSIGGFCTWNIVESLNNYIGAYRNDSLNKKVYCVFKDSINETLLYDFALDLYDTLPPTYGNNSYCYVTNLVNTIDSIQIGNHYHKRYGIGDDPFLPPYTYLIEGIGSEYGLFGFICPPFEFGSTLLCFQQDGITVYPELGFGCYVITGISNSEQNSNLIQMSPNPIVYGSSVSVTSGKTNISMHIYNLLGKEVAEFLINDKNSILDLKSLSTGLYICQFVNMNQQYCQKKLVIIK